MEYLGLVSILEMVLFAVQTAQFSLVANDRALALTRSMVLALRTGFRGPVLVLVFVHIPMLVLMCKRMDAVVFYINIRLPNTARTSFLFLLMRF